MLKDTYKFNIWDKVTVKDTEGVWVIMDNGQLHHRSAHTMVNNDMDNKRILLDYESNLTMHTPYNKETGGW